MQWPKPVEWYQIVWRSALCIVEWSVSW